MTTSAAAENGALGHPGKQREPVLVLLVSLGGGAGALTRYAVGAGIPAGGGIPWATYVVNVLGCLAMGALVVLLARLRPEQRFLRPFWGVGFLGGFTTFSACAVGGDRLLREGAVLSGAAYLGGTALSAVLAVAAGAGLARLATRGHRTGPPCAGTAATGTEEPLLSEEER